MTRYISQTETAQIIRKTLKEQFPKVKFSVKQHYNSIYVRWTDGPALTRVSPVVKAFEGSTFDGMYDLKSYVTSEYEGEEVQFGADYVFPERKKTRGFVEAILSSYQRHWGRTSIGTWGTDEDLHFIDTYEHRNDFRMLNELMDCTDAKDARRAYEALNEREAQRRAEWEAGAEERQRQQEEDDRIYQEQERIRQEQEAEAERLRQKEHARKQAEQAAANKAYRERQAMREGQRAILTNAYTARMFLGVPMTASESQIKGAFTRKVKEAADGRGGYTMDMAFLVAVKEKALSGD